LFILFTAIFSYNNITKYNNSNQLFGNNY